MSGRRNSPINHVQKKLLIEFVKQHPELVSGQFSASFSFKDAQGLWENIGEKLNAVPGGAVKDWKKWRKSWQDIKNGTKSKIVEKKKDMNRTGGGPPLPEPIIDEVVAALINVKEIEGHMKVPEANIDFEFNVPENIEMMEREVEPELREVEPELREEVVETMEGDEEKENVEAGDHLYGMTYPKGLPQQKISKSKKMQASINISQQMVNGLNTRTTIMDSYYSRKINHFDEQERHNKKMEELEEKKINAMEKNNEMMSKILANIPAAAGYDEEFFNNFK